MKTRKKLIEVALPLEAINVASAREKSIRHGHPSTLHLWWARRPLAAARAVIFSQMVDDPSEYADELLADPVTRREAERDLGIRHAAWAARVAHQTETAATEPSRDAAPDPEPTLAEVVADIERQRLFRLIEQLVLWENTTNEPLLEEARAEILRSWRRTCADNADHPRAAELFDPERLPAFHDPFAGGGALPLEAQRLGLEAYASDLNPVAVLINKAMIEIPPRFAGRPPVNPEARARTGYSGTWKGAQGLAEDVRSYGQWIRDEAEKRIGHLYPKVEVTAEMVRERPDLKPYVGRGLTVIAWLWARTVKSPNPAFTNVDVPLVSTFMLSVNPSRQAYLEPVVEAGAYRFAVKVGKPANEKATLDGTKTSRANFTCLMSGVPIPGDYIKAEGMAGRMGTRLLAIVAEGERGRVYLPATEAMELLAQHAVPTWQPDVAISGSTQYLGVKPYGMELFGQLFTRRQLVALTTFSDLVQEAFAKVRGDAIASGLGDDGVTLAAGGSEFGAYAEAVVVYLGFAFSKLLDMCNTICRWGPTDLRVRNLFSRQAIQMSWDFAEANPLADAAGGFQFSNRYLVKAIQAFHSPVKMGHCDQADARFQSVSVDKVISTDPPYYDNVPYADLSDFFYVWLRRSMKSVFPTLLATIAVPKSEELVAFAYRHDGRVGAEAFFLDGMTQAMHRLAEQSHPAFPVTVYYAFKQTESDVGEGTASTGWETFLDALMDAGFATSGTWPMRTELGNRMRGMESNALASSIILVCRPRTADAPTATRRDFVTALKAELPVALDNLQRGNIAPVDLAQAAIGPGMAVYTRYANVLDAEGKPLSVREALALINRTLDETLAEQEGDFDADSRWALTWFEQHGFEEAAFGEADLLARAKNTSVSGMVEAGIVTSRAGKVRLLKPAELPADWDPTHDARRPAWEAVHQLIRTLDEGGEAAAAELITKLGPDAEIARELAYRLYVLCERKKRTTEALWYNGLVQSWTEASRLAREAPPAARPEQQRFFGEA